MPTTTSKLPGFHFRGQAQARPPYSMLSDPWSCMNDRGSYISNDKKNICAVVKAKFTLKTAQSSFSEFLFRT
jgi:hypothetical protein